MGVLVTIEARSKPMGASKGVLDFDTGYFNLGRAVVWIQVFRLPGRWHLSRIVHYTSPMPVVHDTEPALETHLCRKVG